MDAQLKDALDELAAQVPRTDDPWAEHERRIAARTRARRGWTVAAAACVLLVAAVAAPFVFANLQQGPPDVAQPPSPNLPEQPGDVPVAEYLNGGYRTLSVSVSRRSTGDVLCPSEKVRQSGRGGTSTEDFTCRTLPHSPGRAAVTALPLPFCDTGDPNAATDCAQVTGVVLVAVDPAAASVQVTTADGRMVKAREQAQSQRAKVFVADYPDTSDADQPRALDRQQLHVVARDADGKPIEKVVLRG